MLLSEAADVTSFLRAFAFGLGVFSMFLGVAGKLLSVGDNGEILGSIAIGVAALVLRFTVFRERSLENVK